MNLVKINEIRANAGLPALAPNPGKAAQKKRQADNAAKRAADNQRIRTLRNKGGK